MSPPQRTLAVIVARGGSKGLPGKNIRPVHGLPLIAWTILAARRARRIDRLVLSSDDPAIIAVAREYGCEAPFVRPAPLATDEAGSADVLAHAIQSLDETFDLAVLLQPTSPLRSAEDIDASVDLLIASGAPSVISVCQTGQSPFWMYSLNPDGILVPLIPARDRPARRQDAPPAYAPNGAVYVVRTARFLADRRFVHDDTRAWLMPPRRSVDIDTQEDLDWLEFLCERYPELPPVRGSVT